MESYLRFWRLFPRLALGFVFLFLTLLGIFGEDRAHEFFNKLRVINTESLGSLSSGIILIVAIILFCSLGLFLLDLVCYGAGLFLTLIFRIPFLNNLPGIRHLAELTLPISKEIEDIITGNRTDIQEFIYFKSASNPDLISHTRKIKKMTEEAITHTLNFNNKDLIEGIALYGSLTQDRKWLESVKDNISELYYLQTTILAALIVLSIYHLDFTFYLIYASLEVVSLVIFIPLLKDRRRTYAFFILLSYLDNFATWEAATTQDRDAV